MMIRKVFKLLCVALGLIFAVCNVSFGQSKLVNRLENIFYSNTYIDIPQKIFAASDYGAVGDGEKLNTRAIQSAIDAAHEAGGGMVTLPKGINVSGALFLKSDVELRLDEGVVLQAVNDNTQYPEKWTRIAGIEKHPVKTFSALGMPISDLKKGIDKIR